MKYQLKDLPEINNIQNIFFVGIKGVGMTPLAIIAKQAGFNVAGSDISDEFITDVSLNSEEVIIFEDFETSDIKLFFENYDKEECLVITTGAHKGFDNTQSKWAKENGINVISQGQALGIFMDGTIFRKDFKGVSVAGSHGKTTISSLLSSTLVLLDRDPTYTVGTGEIFPIGNPGHFGKGEYFIAEADEYASEPVHDKVPKFLYQMPYFAIFNNIDFDHPDLFKDIDDVANAFLEFGHNIKSGGTLFLNGDDKLLLDLKEKLNKDIRIVTYGKNSTNDYTLKKLVLEGFSSRFTVFKKDEEVGFFEINIPGIHNAYNALSVIAFLFELGFSPSEIRQSLKKFTGTKRRMEMIGKTSNGAIIIDDYGHHPLEIKSTLSAIKNAYPQKKIIAIFQSHTYSRTKSLLKDFVKAFEDADALCLLPIFRSQRDTENDVFSNEDYLKAFESLKEVELIENFPDMVKYMSKKYNSDEFVIVTIGAGDLYKIGYKLAEI